MALDLTVVDAFTDRPFTGNPAAVAVVDEFPSGNRMQAVAREMNLSETAFVARRADGDHDLRWFTPAVEVDLCGHATLASAHLLGGSATFHTRSGILNCKRGLNGMVEMSFPADPPSPAEVPSSLAGIDLSWYGRGRFDILVQLRSAAAIRAFQPDLATLAALGSRGVVITASGDRPNVDCVSRVFAPNVGVAEDPVTGSAHCMLAVFWGDVLGKDGLVGEQASERGGTVHMSQRGDRVVLAGKAVTVSEVRLLV